MERKKRSYIVIACLCNSHKVFLPHDMSCSDEHKVSRLKIHIKILVLNSTRGFPQGAPIPGHTDDQQKPSAKTSIQVIIAYFNWFHGGHSQIQKNFKFHD